MIDEEGFMKVASGGDVLRRRAYAEHVICPGTKKVVGTAYKPELREGEILVEMIGGPPKIIKAY